MKPQLTLELEKKLNCTFNLVDLEEINKYKGEKTSEYSTDENGSITGIAIRKFELKEIPQTLPKFKTLAKLNLGQNQISDISLLKELKNIRELDLGGNQISDISPLKE